MATNTTHETEVTALAAYVNNTLAEFTDNRKELARKWQRNLNAYRRINNGYWKDEEAEGWRSDVFDAVTKQKIMSAVAICLDSYLQGGKVPFALKATPYEVEAMTGELAQDEAALPEDIQEQIDARKEEMQKTIEEQFRRCKADRALIKHFLSGAVYGITYAKATIEEYVERYYMPIQETLSPSQEHARYEQVEENLDSPAWNYVTTWNIFTDYEETDLRKCHAVIHRQVVSPYQLREMLDGKPGTLPEELTKALSEHASNPSDDSDTSDLPPAIRDVPSRKQDVHYIEYWGRVPKSALDDYVNNRMKQTGTELWTLAESEDDEQSGDMVEVMVGVVADNVVRIAVTDDANQRPFFCAKWEDNFDGQGGIGVADNTEDVQKMRNGILRLFFDNQALSANVQVAVKREHLAKDFNSFKPGQKIDITEECKDAREAIQQVIIQDVGSTLINALGVADKWADQDSMVPIVQQGGQGEAKETAYELSQRLEKSGKYLAYVMQNYDDGLVEPIGKWFYDYNMADPEAPGKGSWELYATGFSSFQDRLDKITAIRELLQVAQLLPEGRVKMLEIFKELAKMSDVDPDQFIVSEEEAAEQGPDPMQEAEIEKIHSEIAENESQIKENEAQAQKYTAETQMAAEKLKLDQLKALEDNSGNGNK